MRKSAMYKALAGVAVIATLAFGGTALATTGTPATAEAAPAVVQTAPTQTPVVPPDVTAPAPAVQSTEVGEPESQESKAAEEPGDENLPGGGHQDPDGVDVNHEFEGIE